MSLAALLLLAFLVATLVAFFFELLPVDVTALCLLTALLLTGVVPLEEAFDGFANHGVLTIGGLFVLSHALIRTGLLEVLGDRLSRRFATRQWIGVGLFLTLVALLSGFLNNTAVVAMTLPLAVDLCRRLKISPSRVLMPLSFAAIFGGTLTLIGTSTNLLVSSLLARTDAPPLGMFEFTPLGLVFLACGMLYVLFFAPRLLPSRTGGASLARDFDMEPYLTELEVSEGSGVIGKTVRDLQLNTRYDVTVLAVVRGERRITDNLRALALREGDLLVARGAMEDILKLRQEQGVALLSDVKLTDEDFDRWGGDAAGEGAKAEQVLVEALVRRGSALIGRTLEQVDFRRRYGGFVLAVRREAATLRERLAKTRLQFADTLLLVTSRDRLPELRRTQDLLLTTELDLQLRRERFWWLPVVLIPLVMVLAATETVDLLTGVLASVALLLALGVLRPQDSYRAVDWQVIVFIAAFIPVGNAMLDTGLADVIAKLALAPGNWFGPKVAPWVAVSLLYLVTSLATEVLTNNAAAIVLTPVALQMGTALEVDPRAFVFAVCFAASASFMTPTGYQTNMMVYGPGNYRFTDFVRFGAPLNLLFWVVGSVMIPVLFPF
jgi:di/tricarboxylate transporter